MRKRDRRIYLSLLTIVVVLGLGSRKFSDILPDFLANYAGDTLWALMVFLGFGFLFKKASSVSIAIYALVFSFSIEISQLYHAPWIDSIRSTTIGGLILGFGFLWSDLVCYSIGIMIGLVFEKLFFEKLQYKHKGNL